MWHDHPFSQRNKTTERALGLWVGGNRKGGWTQFKKGGRQYRWDLHEIGGVRPLCQLWNNDIEMYSTLQHIMKKNFLFLKDSLKP